MRRTLALFPILALAGAAPARAWGAEPREPRATMGQIFGALQVVLPKSLSDGGYGDPEVRDLVLAELTRLARGGEHLEAHGRGRDASFAFLSRSLARDARRIRDLYADGRISESRFLLHELTQTCVACHSRLPSEGSDLSRRFVEQREIAALPLDERAKLEFATRSFDRALHSYEALFADPSFAPDYLDLAGHLDDYLELCLRVLHQPARAERTLTALASRPDLSKALRSNLEHWIASLRALRAVEPGGTPRERARRLLADAEDEARFPFERQALVPYVVAEGLLYRELEESPPPVPERAESYYLLGLIESRIGRSFWVSQTESLLEQAIRLAPASRFAEDAYALLEEFTVSGYTGSAGSAVPEDARARLEELRALIDGARGRAAAPAPS